MNTRQEMTKLPKSVVLELLERVEDDLHEYTQHLVDYDVRNTDKLDEANYEAHMMMRDATADVVLDLIKQKHHLVCALEGYSHYSRIHNAPVGPIPLFEEESIPSVLCDDDETETHLGV